MCQLSHQLRLSSLKSSCFSSNESTAAATALGPSSDANSDDELNLTALSVTTWSKADKLPVAFSEDEKRIAPIEEIRVSPIIKTDEAPSKPDAKQTRQVTSWHWHEGWKKIERH
jgi:hypothetical protein